MALNAAEPISIAEDFTSDSCGFGYNMIREGTVAVLYTMSPNGFMYNKSYLPAGYTVKSSTNLIGLDGPINFPIGTGKVIKGWDSNVVDMKTNE
eukprot:15366990-Ditylum_brightwellii.AAC.1